MRDEAEGGSVGSESCWLEEVRGWVLVAMDVVIVFGDPVLPIGYTGVSRVSSLVFCI